MDSMLTTKQVADYLKVHEMTIYRWAKKGYLPMVKIGGRWRVRKEALEEFLTANARP